MHKCMNARYVYKGSSPIIFCLNIFLLLSKLVYTFHSEPSCVVVSPDGKLVAVGTGEGTIHLLHTETGQVTVKHIQGKTAIFK